VSGTHGTSNPLWTFARGGFGAVVGDEEGAM